ncbi:MAG: PaaI family thioesterase [Spirochaetaceae bacterium]|nr:PaaI family thioesterase [Spirochaetaceae bacterium]HPG27471.1 PaaI family thioesterase [Myxococcota bacterium]
MNRTEPDARALEDAVAQVRELIAHLRKTTAEKALLEQVASEVASLNRKLAPADHAGPYMQAALFVPEGPRPERTTDVPAEYFRYSPIIGPGNPVAPPVEFHLEGEEMTALHVFDAPYNGPPTSVHGGVIALVFDELLGCLGAMRDVGGFTGTLTVVYRSLTPIGKPIRMRSWIDRQEGVKVFIKGTMHHEETLCAEAEGIFIRPKASILEDALSKGRS